MATTKLTLTLADGTAREYSRRIDAVRAGDKSGQAYEVRNPKGDFVTGSLGPAVAPSTPMPPKGPQAAAARKVAARDAATHARTERIERKERAKNADALPPKARTPRTWTVASADATHVCAGTCGKTLPASSFPTTKMAGQRGVECRKCRDARLAD